MSIELKNITKKFENKILFSSFDLQLPDKGIVAIVGESGVGKTTLLRMIAGLDNDYSGTISNAGIKNCSFAFQEYRLFPGLSAIDNLIYALEDKKSEETIVKAKEMLKRLGFKNEDFNKLPGELSGGMKQRVSLARAFLRNTPVLLLDEPTKELDGYNISLVLEEISRQAKNRLVLVVTHRTEDIDSLKAQILRI